MKILESNMLNEHEDVEYLYVFHDLATHKVANKLHYAISKTNYFMSKESFYKQHEMLQEGVDGKDFKDQASVVNHIATLNKTQLKTTEKKRKELQGILSSAPNSDHISNVIKFHDEVIGLILEWFNIHDELLTEDAQAIATEVENGIKEFRSPKANQTYLGKQDKNIFRNDGETWTINFKDIKKTVKHTKGMDYIALLLRHQGQRLHSMKMYQIISEIVPDVDEIMSKTSPERIESDERLQVEGEDVSLLVDQKTIDAVKEEIKQLEVELNQAMMEHDSVRENKISIKLDKLNDYLAKCIYRGKIGTVSGATERMRQSISKAINIAKKNIKKHHKELFKHLDKFLTTGTFNSYSPDTPVSWVQNQ